jgi:uncharacterized protein (TIGR02145 family)
VGATKITEYGEYYAWGENAPKDTYYATNYKWGIGSTSVWGSSSMSFTKYCDSVDGKTELDGEDDAATFVWGNGWRMPTQNEFQELLDYCSWEWTYIDDGYENYVYGYLIVSNVNDNSIFLPAAGRKYQAGLSKDGQSGRYASRTCTSAGRPYGLFFDSSDSHYVETYSREYGYSVRPVFP